MAEVGVVYLLYEMCSMSGAGGKMLECAIINEEENAFLAKVLFAEIEEVVELEEVCVS
jgi:hypothetical protein